MRWSTPPETVQLARTVDRYAFEWLQTESAWYLRTEDGYIEADLDQCTYVGPAVPPWQDLPPCEPLRSYLLNVWVRADDEWRPLRIFYRARLPESNELVRCSQQRALPVVVVERSEPSAQCAEAEPWRGAVGTPIAPGDPEVSAAFHRSAPEVLCLPSGSSAVMVPAVPPFWDGAAALQLDPSLGPERR